MISATFARQVLLGRQRLIGAFRVNPMQACWQIQGRELVPKSERQANLGVCAKARGFWLPEIVMGRNRATSATLLLRERGTSEVTPCEKEAEESTEKDQKQLPAVTESQSRIRRVALKRLSQACACACVRWGCPRAADRVQYKWIRSTLAQRDDRQ